MVRHTLSALGMAGAVLGTFAAPQGAHAASEDDLRELREQVRQLKESYEKRIEALEKRLQQSEQSAGKAEAAAPRAEVAANPVALQASSGAAGESAFNPGISLILNGTYGNLKRDPARYRISGFAPTGGEVNPPNRGLSLGESELVVSANVDHLFRGTLIAALSPDDRISVEEGFLQTTGLSNGF